MLASAMEFALNEECGVLPARERGCRGTNELVTIRVSSTKKSKQVFMATLSMRYAARDCKRRMKQGASSQLQAKKVSGQPEPRRM